MNTFDWKKLLPAGAAIVLFYLLSLAYFSPVLEGKRLVQGDKRNWRGHGPGRWSSTAMPAGTNPSGRAACSAACPPTR